ncbi:aquaporin-5-like isoform X2 [Gigantopelta aegis]|uniref:aquaporin-5-like isoform X2 n=1 Tax=Gigantopelta aegis TaxID=1735272 RepID=UPI001B888753|nr:aquaporin-5-like isoform X2 [Gigantopelta aegis]
MAMEGLYVHIANKIETVRFGLKSGKYKLFDSRELKSVHLWRAVFCEFIGSVVFVFLGCSASIGERLNGPADYVDLLRISFSFGLAIMALIQCVGHVSGGHINPAVSIAMAVSMNISILKCILYCAAQTVGCIIGAFILKGLTPVASHDNLGMTLLNDALKPAQGFGVELLLTFTLCTVIFGTTDPNRASFGSPAVLIGLTVALDHFSGIQYTGASMNPSRSLATALASTSERAFEHHWIYWAGPIAGAVLSALVYKLVISPYKGIATVESAVETMLQDQNMIAIPRDYFKDAKSAKVNEMNASSNL